HTLLPHTSTPFPYTTLFRSISPAPRRHETRIGSSRGKVRKRGCRKASFLRPTPRQIKDQKLSSPRTWKCRAPPGKRQWRPVSEYRRAVARSSHANRDG